MVTRFLNCVFVFSLILFVHVSGKTKKKWMTSPTEILELDERENGSKHVFISTHDKDDKPRGTSQGGSKQMQSDAATVISCETGDCKDQTTNSEGRPSKEQRRQLINRLRMRLRQRQNKKKTTINDRKQVEHKETVIVEDGNANGSGEADKIIKPLPNKKKADTSDGSNVHNAVKSNKRRTNSNTKGKKTVELELERYNSKSSSKKKKSSQSAAFRKALMGLRNRQRSSVRVRNNRRDKTTPVPKINVDKVEKIKDKHHSSVRVRNNRRFKTTPVPKIIVDKVEQIKDKHSSVRVRNNRRYKTTPVPDNIVDRVGQVKEKPKKSFSFEFPPFERPLADMPEKDKKLLKYVALQTARIDLRARFGSKAKTVTKKPTSNDTYYSIKTLHHDKSFHLVKTVDGGGQKNNISSSMGETKPAADASFKRKGTLKIKDLWKARLALRKRFGFAKRNRNSLEKPESSAQKLTEMVAADMPSKTTARKLKKLDSLNKARSKLRQREDVQNEQNSVAIKNKDVTMNEALNASSLVNGTVDNKDISSTSSEREEINKNNSQKQKSRRKYTKTRKEQLLRRKSKNKSLRENGRKIKLDKESSVRKHRHRHGRRKRILVRNKTKGKKDEKRKSDDLKLEGTSVQTSDKLRKLASLKRARVQLRNRLDSPRKTDISERKSLKGKKAGNVQKHKKRKGRKKKLKQKLESSEQKFERKKNRIDRRLKSLRKKTQYDLKMLKSVIFDNYENLYVNQSHIIMTRKNGKIDHIATQNAAPIISTQSGINAESQFGAEIGIHNSNPQISRSFKSLDDAKDRDTIPQRDVAKSRQTTSAKARNVADTVSKGTKGERHKNVDSREKIIRRKKKKQRRRRKNTLRHHRSKRATRGRQDTKSRRHKLRRKEKTKRPTVPTERSLRKKTSTRDRNRKRRKSKHVDANLKTRRKSRTLKPDQKLENRRGKSKNISKRRLRSNLKKIFVQENIDKRGPPSRIKISIKRKPRDGKMSKRRKERKQIISKHAERRKRRTRRHRRTRKRIATHQRNQASRYYEERTPSRHRKRGSNRRHHISSRKSRRRYYRPSAVRRRRPVSTKRKSRLYAHQESPQKDNNRGSGSRKTSRPKKTNKKDPSLENKRKDKVSTPNKTKSVPDASSSIILSTLEKQTSQKEVADAQTKDTSSQQNAKPSITVSKETASPKIDATFVQPKKQLPAMVHKPYSAQQKDKITTEPNYSVHSQQKKQSSFEYKETNRSELVGVELSDGRGYHRSRDFQPEQGRRRGYYAIRNKSLMPRWNPDRRRPVTHTHYSNMAASLPFNRGQRVSPSLNRGYRQLMLHMNGVLQRIYGEMKETETLYKEVFNGIRYDLILGARDIFENISYANTFIYDGVVRATDFTRNIYVKAHRDRKAKLRSMPIQEQKLPKDVHVHKRDFRPTLQKAYVSRQRINANMQKAQQMKMKCMQGHSRLQQVKERLAEDFDPKVMRDFFYRINSTIYYMNGGINRSPRLIQMEREKFYITYVQDDVTKASYLVHNATAEVTKCLREQRKIQDMFIRWQHSQRNHRRYKRQAVGDGEWTRLASLDSKAKTHAHKLKTKSIDIQRVLTDSIENAKMALQMGHVQLPPLESLDSTTVTLQNETKLLRTELNNWKKLIEFDPNAKAPPPKKTEDNKKIEKKECSSKKKREHLWIFQFFWWWW